MMSGLRSFKLAALAGALWLAAPGFAQKPAEAESAQRATEAPSGRAQPEPRPAIWLLQDADTKIYMFGTVHILPPGFRWRSAAIDGVIRQADELVLEVTDREAMEDPASYLGPMMLGKQAPVLWRVAPERREALRQMLEGTGLPIETFDGMQSWAVWMTMAALSIVQGLSDEEGRPLSMEEIPGVEDALEVEFRELGRAISGVETVAQQVSFLSSLSFADQRALLESMVDEYREGAGGSDFDENDWVRGDVEAIAIGDEDMPRALYDALLTRRNRVWTEWLIRRLDRPGTILFAVGAGHLSGPDSVQAMLTARGFTAARID